MKIALLTLGYIDPVSGTLIIQLIVAGFVAVGAFFRRSIWSCVGWLFGRKSEESDQASPDQGQEEIEK